MAGEVRDGRAGGGGLAQRVLGLRNDGEWEIESPLPRHECERRLRLVAAQGLTGDLPVAVTGVGEGRFEAMLKASRDQVVGSGSFPWPTMSGFGILASNGGATCLRGGIGVPTALALPTVGILGLGVLTTTLGVVSLLDGQATSADWGLAACGVAGLAGGAALHRLVVGLFRGADRAVLLDELAKLVDGHVVTQVQQMLRAEQASL